MVATPRPMTPHSPGLVSGSHETALKQAVRGHNPTFSRADAGLISRLGDLQGAASCIRDRSDHPFHADSG